jgi:uncharacterized protein YlbG (UPF0298 family)
MAIDLITRKLNPTRIGIRGSSDTGNPYQLSGHFVLQHWQAQPKGLRHFGYFEFVSGDHRYLTIPYNLCTVEVCPEPIQIDERLYKTVPTAVNLFRNSQLIKEGTQWKIQKLNGN